MAGDFYADPNLPPAAAQVLAFWFGRPGDPVWGKVRDEWFTKRDDFDAGIRDRFGSLVEQALQGRCDGWLDHGSSAMALVVLLDQFPRNIYRGTARSFAGDPQALAAARLMVAHGWDQRVLPVQRVFCYLPFEHSELLADQQESMRLYALLYADPAAGGTIEWAQKHHDIIARFGRFPHRNLMLGRQSSAEEIAFLREPGSRF